MSLAELGRFSEAVSEAEQAVLDAEACEAFPALSQASMHLGRVLLLQGQPEGAIPVLERSHSLARTWHIGLLEPAVAGALRYAYLLAGRHAALRALWPPPPRRRLANAAGAWVEPGECLLAFGHVEEAMALAHEALDLARQFGERGHEARALAFLATVEARRAGARGGRAGEIYDQAMAMAEELGMRPLVARCQLDAGCLWLAAGHLARAHEHLEREAAMFRELDMHCWLAQAEAALGGEPGAEARLAP